MYLGFLSLGGRKFLYRNFPDDSCFAKSKPHIVGETVSFATVSPRKQSFRGGSRLFVVYIPVISSASTSANRRTAESASGSVLPDEPDIDEACEPGLAWLVEAAVCAG